MEMILISTNKLKIILSQAELESFDLTVDMLDYGNTETKKMLWDLLAKAKHSIGFDPDGYRVFVQLYPSKDGSCELFVTKMVTSDKAICDRFYSDSIKCEESDTDEYENEYDSYEDIDNQKTTVVFAMDSLGALCDACRRLVKVPFSGKSSIYIFNGIFYLLLFIDPPYFSYKIDEFSLLGEYGTQSTSKELLMNLYEFGKAICEDDAIKTFSSL